MWPNYVIRSAPAARTITFSHLRNADGPINIGSYGLVGDDVLGSEASSLPAFSITAAGPGCPTGRRLQPVATSACSAYRRSDRRSETTGGMTQERALTLARVPSWTWYHPQLFGAAARISRELAYGWVASAGRGHVN